MTSIDWLAIKLYADGADIKQIRGLAGDSRIKGFTTNPTLMRKAGVADYAAFARQALAVVAPRPISFEVFADDLLEMRRQAETIARWGENVFVKIPVTNTKGESTAPIIAALTASGVQVNVTAVFTIEQVTECVAAFNANTPSNISIFAGRIADTGCDPVPIVRRTRELLSAKPKVEIIWASPRELLNIWHAESAGCHIITMTSDLLGKLALCGKSLTEYSLETVSMFYEDARKAGYSIAETDQQFGR